MAEANKVKRKISQSVLKELIEEVPIVAGKPVLERIALPIVWQRLPCGVRVQDLQPVRYTDVVSIIMDHYFEDEPMMHAVGMSEDEESQEEFLHLVSVWLKDTQSLIAVTEGEATRVVGVLIGRTVDHSSHVRTYSRVSSVQVNKEAEMKPAEMSDAGCLYADPGSEITIQSSAVTICNEPVLSEVSARGEPLLSSQEVHWQLQRSNLAQKQFSGSEEKIVQKTLKRRPRQSAQKKHGSSGRTSSRQSQNLSLHPIITPSAQPPISMFDDIDVLYSGEALLKVQDLRMHMSKEIDIFEIYNVDMYHRVYLWLVIPEFRNLGIGKALLRSAIDVTRCMGVEVVCGQMTSRVAQNIAYKMGFAVEGEMLYSAWVRGDEEVFRDVTTGNHSLAVMALRLFPTGPDAELVDDEVMPPPGRKSRRRPVRPQ